MDPEDDPSTKSDGRSCGGLRNELKECMLKSDCVVKVRFVELSIIRQPTFKLKLKCYKINLIMLLARATNLECI